MTDHRTDWTAADSRLACYWRQGTLCARCWEPLGQPDGEWEAHHRLRRSWMPKEALWCPCNIVALHARCHTQGPGRPGDGQWAVHDWPIEAGVLGLLLPSHADPRKQWVMVVWPWQGSAFLDCDSTVVSPFAHSSSDPDGP